MLEPTEPQAAGRRVRYLAVVGFCVVGGCAAGPDFTRPGPPAVDRYLIVRDPDRTAAARGVAQQFQAGAVVEGDWWRLFKSSQLDAVVKEALVENPGLEAAQARLREAGNSLRSGYGVFFPAVDVGASATRQRISTVRLGEAGSGAVFNLFTLSASVNYALDLFGGERRALEALGAQVDVQAATEHATYVTLIANVVNVVIAAAAYRAEIDATSELIRLQRQQVALTEVRVKAGMEPYSSVLSLESQLAGTQASIPQLEQRLAQSEDLLATLVGRLPAQWTAPPVRLGDLTLPKDIPVSFPSELVRQRPDILIAEATAHAASANIGVATAAMLPSVTLNGSYSASGTTTTQMFGAAGRAWDVGGSAVAPLFEGGTLWFRRKAAVDAYHESMASYRETVVAAFGQVADTLQALGHDAEALAAQEEGLSAAGQALHLIQTDYEAGLATYLNVLAANTLYQQAVIGDLQAAAVRLQDTVALYAALGGGWWNASGSH